VGGGSELEGGIGLVGVQKAACSDFHSSSFPRSSAAPSGWSKGKRTNKKGEGGNILRGGIVSLLKRRVGTPRTSEQHRAEEGRGEGGGMTPRGAGTTGMKRPS